MPFEEILKYCGIDKVEDMTKAMHGSVLHKLKATEESRKKAKDEVNTAGK